MNVGKGKGNGRICEECVIVRHRNADRRRSHDDYVDSDYVESEPPDYDDHADIDPPSPKGKAKEKGKPNYKSDALENKRDAVPIGMYPMTPRPESVAKKSGSEYCTCCC